MARSPDFEQLYKASIDLLNSNSLNQTYKIICSWSIKLVNAKYCSVFELNEEIPVKVFASDEILYGIGSYKNDRTHNVARKLKSSLKHKSDMITKYPELKKLKFGSDITVPLNYGGHKYGALSVLSHEEKLFDSRDLETMTFFATLASFSLRQIKLNEKLKEAVSDRDLFISIVAHEIRNPLTLLQAYAELITRYAAKGIQPNQDIINKVKTSIKRVNNLITEFLNIQQIKSGTINYDFNKEDLKKILDEAIENFHFQYPLHIIKFKLNEHDEHYPIYADYEKMHLVLLNVLKNAGRYSSSKDPIIISLANYYGKVLLKVSDKGKGISKRDLEHVFEKYFTRNASGKVGMGLGLFLAKNILTAHHGTIEIHSAKDAGTTVMIKLPDYANGRKKKSHKNKKLK